MTAKPLMVQGTMSNAGKSLLVAGLCRVFRQDGLRVVPFKSQNMALNSFVTADGLELGRAQAMQAEACGVDPVAAMNPILLKPESDRGSQVIVRGKSIGTMSARDYFAYKERLVPTVRAAFDELCAEADIVVIEGAGSPAEINLAKGDIVNMGLARMTSSPVLLAGDIDPGGVFAQLYGTVALQGASDRARIKGLIVNKFRGDPAILRPGLDPLERLCGVPVLGVVPYTPLDLDDEDSLSPKLAARAVSAPIDVAAVRLPHLSNFTDLDALGRVEAAGVRWVSRAADLGRPDLVVLPGTKSALSDARWLAESGLAACVRALAQAGTPTIGICGGFQLLGQTLCDVVGADGGGEARGLGLLPVRTEFCAEKKLGRASGRVRVASGVFSALDGRQVEGYEIHAGRSFLSAEAFSAIDFAGEEEVFGGALPAGSPVSSVVSGNVLGTYLHGLFDAPGVAEALVNALLRARGLPEIQPGAQEGAVAHKQRQYDKLADVLRASLDMEAIYRIVEEGCA